jgi:hypothetical protein
VPNAGEFSIVMGKNIKDQGKTVCIKLILWIPSTVLNIIVQVLNVLGIEYKVVRGIDFLLFKLNANQTQFSAVQYSNAVWLE